MSELFEDLEPPPGGLARLRAAVAEEQKGPALWPSFALAASAAAAVFLWVQPPPPPPSLGDNPALVSLGLAPPPPEGVVGVGDTVVRAAGGTEEVQLYWLGSPDSPQR